MILLAIDTSAQLCAAAVHDMAADKVLSAVTEDIGKGHAERLMDVIALALGEAGVDYSGIGAVAATRGPGSFTGVRIGLATARGISLALGFETIGVSTLEAAAFHAAGRPVAKDGPPLLAVIDARRGEAFCQAFGSHDLDTRPFVAPYHEIAAMTGRDGEWRLCGSGAEHLNAAAGAAHEIVHALQGVPIDSVARLAATLDANISPAEPLYLRAPDARPQENFVLRRA